MEQRPPLAGFYPDNPGQSLLKIGMGRCWLFGQTIDHPGINALCYGKGFPPEALTSVNRRSLLKPQPKVGSPAPCSWVNVVTGIDPMVMDGRISRVKTFGTKGRKPDLLR